MAKTRTLAPGKGREASSTTVTPSAASRSRTEEGSSGAGIDGGSGRKRETSRSVTTKKKQTSAASTATAREAGGGVGARAGAGREEVRSGTAVRSGAVAHPARGGTSVVGAQFFHHVSQPTRFGYAAPMRPRLLVSALVTTGLAAALVFGVVVASADPPAGKEIRRDPENKKGISPYMELIVKGQSTFIARDIPGAIAVFQEAIKLDPEQMLAFYRLGEAEQEAGKLDDAEKAWEAALSKKGHDNLKGKVLFCIAGLRERQQKWQAAKDAWQSYAAFLQGNPKVMGFPATAADRIKQIDRRVQLEADYGKVKERIAQRIREKEKEASDNAKKDKLNK